jgi:hypothetical protein
MLFNKIGFVSALDTWFPPPTKGRGNDIQEENAYVQTSLGTLDFKDGAPSEATAQKLYDNLDLLRAGNVYLNTFQGASTYTIGEGETNYRF